MLLDLQFLKFSFYFLNWGYSFPSSARFTSPSIRVLTLLFCSILWWWFAWCLFALFKKAKRFFLIGATRFTLFNSFLFFMLIGHFRWIVIISLFNFWILFNKKWLLQWRLYRDKSRLYFLCRLRFFYIVLEIGWCSLYYFFWVTSRRIRSMKTKKIIRIVNRLLFISKLVFAGVHNIKNIYE